MRSPLLPMLTCLSLVLAALAPELSARAEGEPSAIIEKAIKAHGGKDNLVRARAFHAKGKGTMNLGGTDVPCTLEITAQLPGQYRMAGTLGVGTARIAAVQALDGEQGWAAVNGATAPLAGKALAELKAQLYVRRLLRLAPLLTDKRFRLAPLAEASVNDRPVVGVAVTCNGGPDVSLYFDKGTGLLAKLERQAYDDSTKKAFLQEGCPGDFKDIDGLPTPMKQVWRRGGRKVLEIIFTEVRYPNRIAERQFAMPSAVETAFAADRNLLTHTPEVVYGRKFGTALTLDVFAPKKGANGAAVIVVVSGGWVSDRERFAPFYAPFVRTLVKRGYTVFAVCHGCQPKFMIPEAVADIDRATRYIRAHAEDYGISPDRIGITGGSAGGHLSLMQGTAGTEGDKKGKDLVERTSSRVQAVACLFPPTDFLNYGIKGAHAFAPEGTLAAFRTAVDVREYDPKTKRFERISAEKALELARKISPITHITAETAPTLIVHGDADKLVPIQQAEVFIARLKEVGVPAELVVKKGAGHGWAGMDKDLAVLADWFDKHLNRKKEAPARRRTAPQPANHSSRYRVTNASSVKCG